MGQGSSPIRPRTVTGDGAGMVSHAGIAWLADTADLARLTAGLSKAMTAVPQRLHDPGRTLAQMILALADGATCLSDLAAVRAQRSMFGEVASEATVWRTFDGTVALVDRVRLIACLGASSSPSRVSVVRWFPVPTGGDSGGGALVLALRAVVP